MNPIEKAVTNADKITAANRSLEGGKAPAAPGQGGKSLAAHLSGMKHNEILMGQANGAHFSVHYMESPSYGDNNQPVRGATTGMYTVSPEFGRQSYHEHGPHANTAAAARKGANPNAKYFAAEQAAHAVHESSMPSIYRDRRFR
jgi:hypothetical protein